MSLGAEQQIVGGSPMPSLGSVRLGNALALKQPPCSLFHNLSIVSRNISTHHSPPSIPASRVIPLLLRRNAMLPSSNRVCKGSRKPSWEGYIASQPQQFRTSLFLSMNVRLRLPQDGCMTRYKRQKPPCVQLSIESQPARHTYFISVHSVAQLSYLSI
jgi:hypothetical protein